MKKILLSLFFIAYFSLHAADGTDSFEGFFTSLDHLGLDELALTIGFDPANPSDAAAASSPDKETLSPAQPADEVIIDRQPEENKDFKKTDSKFNFKCLHCGLQEKGIGRIREHIEVEHFRTKVNQCDQCLKTFFRENDLREHKSTIHDLSRKFRCPYPSCPYRCNHRGDLNKHAQATEVHKKYRPFHKGNPDWSIINVNTTDADVVDDADDVVVDGVKGNQCDQCFKTFSRENDLEYHKSTIHALSRKFRCPYPSCPYRCNHRGDLNKHAKAKKKNLKELGQFHNGDPDWSIININTTDADVVVVEDQG